MNIFIKLMITISLLFAVAGCQSNNSAVKKVVEIPDGNVTDPIEPPDGNVTDPVDPVDPVDPPDQNVTDPVEPEEEVITVILPVSGKEVTINSEVVNISVTVIDNKNNPYSDGNVKIVYPDDIRQGRDIGYFTSSTVVPVNGVAQFVYTAPFDLESNKANLVFKFYHDSNPTEVVPFTVTIKPSVNQTVLTNYTLKTSNPNDVNMELESNKIVAYTVYDENDNQVSDADMKSMTVTSLNPSLGVLEDNFGNSGPTITLANKNSMSVNIVSNTKSGIVPLKVDATFNDVNGEEQNLTKVFNMLVLSGPPSAISLAYAGVEQAAERAKFVEKWVVTVTDKYNNLVNTTPAISAGLIAGYAKSSQLSGIPGNYLYYGPDNASEVGDISASADTFTAQNDVFSNVDLDNDVLATFGTGYKYEALGKWDIETIASPVLGIEDYNGTNTTGLGFAVGHNHREDTCRIGSKWVANVYPVDNSYVIDETGTLVLNVEYDYYLVGKSTMLWVNLIGIQHSSGVMTKIGEASKITLAGTGLQTASYTYAKGYTGTVRFPVKISDTREYYRNANFGYHAQVTGDGTVWHVSGDSMDQNITSCVNDGIGYVDITITSSPENGGEMSVVNILPSAEF